MRKKSGTEKECGTEKEDKITIKMHSSYIVLFFYCNINILY